MDQSIIEKIKKLFALGNRDKNSNEAEASAAMAKAQELLTKYNLDLKAIQDSAPASAAGAAVTGKRERVHINRSAMYNWQKNFWRALAEANFCWHWVTDARAKTNKGDNRWVKRHVILGAEVNVAAVTMMGEYLTEVIERELPYENRERLSKSALSWREGCAERLIERIQAKQEEMKTEGVKSEGTVSTALAVRNLEEVEYRANYDARYGEGAWVRNQKWEAEYEAGRAARAEQDRLRWARQDAEKAEKLAKETSAQKAKREEREQRAAEREARRERRERYKELDRLDYTAYSSGKRAANKINLDDQLKGR